MTLLFNGDFFFGDKWTGVHSFFWGAAGGNQYSCVVSSDRAQLISNIGGRSDQTIKFTSKYNDLCNANVPRAYITKSPNPYISNGMDRYYSVSLYLPSDFSLTSNEWLQPWEIQSSNPAAELVNLKLRAIANDDHLYIGVGPESIEYQLPILYTNMISSWSDFIIRVRFSTTTAGIVDIWHKYGSESTYTLLKSINNVRTFQGSETGEMAFGIYRANIPATRVIYVSGLKIGTTFDDVKYSGSPLPPPPPDPSIWVCEQPLNGMEKDQYGNTRANPACSNKPPLPQEFNIERSFLVLGGTLILREILKK